MKRSITMLLAALFCLNLFAQTKPSKGDGSAASPYKISNAQELLWFAQKVNGKLAEEKQDLTLCGELTADIDLSEVCGEAIGNWDPIGFARNNYGGTFDGNGYGIKNLYLSETSSSIIGRGFFGVTDHATITNLSILSGFINTENVNIGAIAGNAYQSTIINCHNYIPVTGGKFTGGIVGYTNGSSISKCHNEGEIKLTSDHGCGGICGGTYGAKVSYCYNVGNIIGKNRAGAIVGSHENGASLTNSFAYNSDVSLIGGNSSSTSSNCYLNDAKNSSSSSTKTKEQFASGEVCYLLNEDSENPIFFQSIGVNEYPVLNSVDVVFKDEEGYYNESQFACEHKDTITVAPTCTASGYVCCSKCRKKFDMIPQTQHDTTITVVKTADCKSIGYSSAKCSKCDLFLYYCDTVPALGHDTVKTIVKPTCSRVGYTNAQCSTCKATFYYCDTVPTLDHDTVKTIAAPTCTKNGYSKAQCSMCDLLHYYCDTVPAVGHDTKETIDEPTCTRVGYTRVNCKVCGWLLYRKDTVPALGHVKIDTTIHPTCSVEGYDITKCKRCNYTSDKTNYTAPTMDHDYDGDVCTVCKHQRIEKPKLEDGFYLISNARELLWFAEYVNSWHPKVNARLITDIDMAEVCGEGIGNWEPIGKYSNRYHYFSGIFDGNGHKIYNIYHKSKQQDIALFGYVQNAVIKDLWASGLISAYDYIAGFCYSIRSSTISGCVNDIYVDLRDDLFGYAAGICTNADDSKIENCLQHGIIKTIVGDAALTKAGGITTDAYPNSTVKNCVNYKCNQTAKSIYTDFDKDDISSLIEISNNYIVEKDQDSILKTTKGTFTPEELCFRLNFNGINWGTAIIDSIEMAVPKAFASKIIYPSGTVTCPLNHDYKTYGYEPSKIEYLHPNHIDADNDSIYDCCGMYHSDLIFPNSDGFYEICSAEQFKNFADAVKKGFRTLNVKLTCDIDLSDYCNENIGSWKPIGQFEGIFDGQHHKISGLYINDSTSYSGLFSKNKGVIKNVAITKDCKLKGETIGAICANNQGRIEKCSNEANVEGYMAGGIVGEQSSYHDGSYLKHCYNTGDISGTIIGGIAGICNTDMDYCHSYGRINRQEPDNQNRYIGGVSGLAMVEDGGFFGTLYCIETGLCPEDKNVQVYDFTTSAEQFASGEICYALNNGQDSTVWYQTLNVDPYPVLDPTHGNVLYDEVKGVYYNYPEVVYSAAEEIENEKTIASLVTFVINRQVIVIGTDSFRIIDMFGHDVTAFNGTLADGIYVVVANGNVAKVVVK